MSDPFFILGLPRSRTAWLATWLTYGGKTCWHDALANVRNAAGLRALADEGAVGFAETAGSYFPRVLHREFPNAKYVFVTRLSTNVEVSLDRLGKPGRGIVNAAAGALNEALAYLRPRAEVSFVQFEALNRLDVLEPLWRYLRDEDMPVAHTRAMLQMRVTKLDPFGGTLPVNMLLEESNLAEQEGATA